MKIMVTLTQRTGVAYATAEYDGIQSEDWLIVHYIENVFEMVKYH